MRLLWWPCSRRWTTNRSSCCWSPASGSPIRSRWRRVWPVVPTGRDPSYLVVALTGPVLVGYVDVTVLPFTRARRSGYVVAGVRADHAGRGLGRALMESAIREAGSRGMGRLELTVMEHNHRALGLYLRCGFQVEGLRRAALDVHGRRVSEYYMGLLLD
ncbi:GNAT family N-acetyltransferase [Kitasatospora sp. NPDC048407]|uniref:GNAT family N-acetyltransferase n=1 Tax=Kitasatospora sp. NPDC048407 TaxID=3364051 RepID=UPI00371C28C0